MGVARYLIKLMNVRFKAVCFGLVMLTLVLLIYVSMSTLRFSKSVKSPTKIKDKSENTPTDDDNSNKIQDRNSDEIDFDLPLNGNYMMDQHDIKDKVKGNLNPKLFHEDMAEDEEEQNVEKFEKRPWKDNVHANYDYAEGQDTELNADNTLRMYIAKGDTAKTLKFIYVINNLRKCETEHVDILVMVESAASHRGERDLIRETWASVTRYRGWVMKTVFLIGAADNEAIQDELHEESKQYHDILQVNIPGHNKYTLEPVIGLKSAINFCHKFTYFVKTSDNVLINVFQLFHFLQEIPSVQRDDFMYCFISKNTNELFLGNLHSNYCAKFAYIMSGRLAKLIYLEMERIPVIPEGDIFITGTMMEKLHLSPIPFVEPYHNDSLSVEYASEDINEVLFLQSKYFITARTWNQVWNAAKKYGTIAV